MWLSIFFIGIITTVFSFIASMFLANMISQSGDPVVILLALLIGTVVGCTMAIINAIKDSN